MSTGGEVNPADQHSQTANSQILQLCIPVCVSPGKLPFLFIPVLRVDLNWMHVRPNSQQREFLLFQIRSSDEEIRRNKMFFFKKIIYRHPPRCCNNYHDNKIKTNNLISFHFHHSNQAKRKIWEDKIEIIRQKQTQLPDITDGWSFSVS